MKMFGGLNNFTARVLFFFLVIFLLSSAVPVGDEPQIISLCDTSFVLKKYSVYPPAGYFSNWFISPEGVIMGGQNENTITVKWTEIGSYTIIAQFSNGKCISQNELNVIVEGCPESTIWIPNSFTPNQDRINDEFGAYGTNIDEFNMDIYNRWGELIFTSDKLEYRWDGYYRGNLCQEDIYVYKIRYKTKNFKSKEIYGRVGLIH